jgi:Spy/CpxP family protein refolding chaperone
MMNTLRVFAFSAALLPVSLATLGVLATGCSGATEQPHTSASALGKAPVGEGTHGPVRIVGAALGEVPLRPEQRAKLEVLVKDADARHASGLVARKDLMTAFADQVERGAIDRAALAPKIEAATGEAQRLRPEDLAALDQAHAILDKEQRAAFVDALEDEIKGAMRGGHGRKGRHGKGGERGEAHEAGAGLWGMKALADEMKLESAQRDQIKEKLKALHEAHDAGEGAGKRGGREGFARMRQAKDALESFKSDDFKAQASFGALANRADGTKAERMFDVAEAVLPILTPEQRKVAADHLRAFAAKGEVPGAR